MKLDLVSEAGPGLGETGPGLGETGPGLGEAGPDMCLASYGKQNLDLRDRLR